MSQNTNQIPQHIVLFPDGNRRWARKKGIDTLKGHMEGYKNLKRFCRWCQKREIKVITAFGFSTENWNRSPREVNYLMKLFEKGLKEGLKAYKEKDKEAQLFGDKVRFRVIGQKEKLPKPLQQIVKKAEDITKNNTEYFLNLAVSYGGRWDIMQAVKKIIRRKIPAEKINEELFGNYLSTAGIPEPDLIIRPSGEKRLSNFLLWQGAYSEIYFCDKLWPDFTEKDLDLALEEYARRQRRFGK